MSSAAVHYEIILYNVS